MFNIPIYYYWLIAIITGVVGVVLLLTWCLLKSIYARSMRTDLENNKSIVIQSNKESDDGNTEKILTEKSKKTKTLQMVLRILNPLLISAYVIALICIFTYAGASAYAKRYGAYDAFDKIETINTIRNLPNTSFIDQSRLVPNGDERLGVILIFYKYNCPDCIETHDMILESLSNYPDAEVYFVSSRSEIGKELVTEYEIQEVPSALYIRIPPEGFTVEDYGPLATLYRDFYERKPDGTALTDENGHNVYTTEGFDFLLMYQQEIVNQMELEQYYQEHPEERPEPLDWEEAEERYYNEIYGNESEETQ